MIGLESCLSMLRTVIRNLQKITLSNLHMMSHLRPQDLWLTFLDGLLSDIRILVKL